MRNRLFNWVWIKLFVTIQKMHFRRKARLSLLLVSACLSAALHSSALYSAGPLPVEPLPSGQLTAQPAETGYSLDGAHESVPERSYLNTAALDNAPIDAPTVKSIRDSLVQGMPESRRQTYLEHPYGWLGWGYDVARNEAALAGTALGFMALARYADARIKPVAGKLLGRFGGLAVDLTVDSLTTNTWTEFAARSGVNSLAWLMSDSLNPQVIFLMRYLLSHGGLLAETLPEIWQTFLPRFQGSRQILCTNTALCDAFVMHYHSPNGDFIPDTAQPWISLEFDYSSGSYSFIPANRLEESFYQLKEWATARGVEAIHLYPGTENGRLRLWARAWYKGEPGKLRPVHGRFGLGSRTDWWTAAFEKNNPDLSESRLVNPLHEEILERLPEVLDGRMPEKVHLKGHIQVVAESENLAAVTAGKEGFLMFDRHLSRSYEMPDIYLNSRQGLDLVTTRALHSFDEARAPAPLRGAGRLGMNILRSTLYRMIFDRAMARLQTYSAQVKAADELADKPENSAQVLERQDGQTDEDSYQGSEDETLSIADEQEAGSNEIPDFDDEPAESEFVKLGEGTEKRRTMARYPDVVGNKQRLLKHRQELTLAELYQKQKQLKRPKSLGKASNLKKWRMEELDRQDELKKKNGLPEEGMTIDLRTPEQLDAEKMSPEQRAAHDKSVAVKRLQESLAKAIPGQPVVAAAAMAAPKKGGTRGKRRAGGRSSNQPVEPLAAATEVTPEQTSGKAVKEATAKSQDKALVGVSTRNKTRSQTSKPLEAGETSAAMTSQDSGSSKPDAPKTASADSSVQPTEKRESELPKRPEPQMFEGRYRKLLVLGQKESGKTSFINYLMGLEGEKGDVSQYRHIGKDNVSQYLSVPVDDGTSLVDFIEVAVSPREESDNDGISIHSQVLKDRIAKADKVFWCGDLRKHSRRSEAPEVDVTLFGAVVRMADDAKREVFTALNYGDSVDKALNDEKSYNTSVLPGKVIETTPEQREAERYALLYSRAARRYQGAGEILARDDHTVIQGGERGIIKKTYPMEFIGLSAQLRGNEEELHFDTIRKSEANPVNSWWEYMQALVFRPVVDISQQMPEAETSKTAPERLPPITSESVTGGEGD